MNATTPRPLQPVPDRDAAPRDISITVRDADHLRALADQHFPRTAAPALHAALDQAEAARTITLTVTKLHAAALRTATNDTTAPDQVYDATRFLTSQLPHTWPDTGTVTVLSTVGHARALHTHHTTNVRRHRTTSSRIRDLITAANYTSRELTVMLPWDAAHTIDTLHALHPTDPLLQHLGRNH